MVTTAVRMGESPPLRELADIPVAEPTSFEDREIPIHVPEFLRELPDISQGPDPLRQVSPGLAQPSHLFDFEGYGSDDNQTLFGLRYAPPDSEGDVGPNHYVSWNNVGYYIYDKTGTSILGPVAGNALWSGFGGYCESDNFGDPIVLYDHLADRWIFSQLVSPSAPDGHQCIAVSKTSDPTGAYWLYDFIVSPAASNDYSKLGVWPDGYYLTANEFTVGFVGARIVAFERAQMLTGGVAQMVSFFLPSGTPGYFSVLPGHLEGPAPAPGTPNPYVMACDDTVWGCGAGGSDGYHLWDFSVDWVTPGNSTFTYNTFLVSANFDTNLCGFSPCVPQPGASTLLETLSQFTMYRAQYRDFDTHQTIVVSHTVDADGADTAGVRWAEIRDTGSGWTLRQAGTYDLGDGVHRWMPSAAMDGTGTCLCIIYSASNGTSVYPSVRYACHEEGVDALGVMGVEQECVAGGGAQTGTSRWGDYSALSLDPNDECTFWGTGEYVAVGGSYYWNTRVCSWQCSSCPAETGTITGTVTDASTQNPLEGARIQPGDYTTSTNSSGLYAKAVLGGNYDVTASKYGYHSDTATGVSVTTGMTTTQNFSLTVALTYALDGNVYDGDDAGWPLAASIGITASDPAGDQVVYTDPGTGYYSTVLVEGETYNVTASAPGYLSDTQSVTVAGAPITLDFYLIPNTSCTAPGYSPLPPFVLIDEDFESGVPPAGWTVIDNASSGPVNWTDLAGCGEVGNYTNGTGDVACASSDIAGVAEFDTELLTPAFDVTDLNESALAFTANYQNLASYDFFEVDLSTNGAAGPWTNLLSWNEDHGGFRATPGEDVVIDLLAAGATGANNRVRFHYFDPNTDDHDWYVQVDDVLINGGDCEFVGGGIFYGYVTEAGNGDPVNGARVEADTGEFTFSRKTHHEEVLDDGYYYLWVPGTATELTAAMTAYQTDVESITPALTPTRLDFVLCSGALAASPETLALRVNIPTGGSSFPVTKQVTIDNNGCLATDVRFVEINTSAAVVAPIPPPAARTSTAWRQLRETDPDAWLRSTAPTTASLDLHWAFPSVRQPAAAGTLVDSWATGRNQPWGIDTMVTYGDPMVWIGDLDTEANHEYATDGTATLRSISSGSLPEVWMADMATDPISGMIWQVGVGNHGCIWEFNPVSLNFTGNKICPNFGAYMRGLAYDPFSETFWAGTWEGVGYIVRFDRDGNILGQWNHELPVAGLTYNLATGHLFALLNTDFLWDIWVFDVTDPDLTVVTAFSSGMPDFAQGGLGHDLEGNLWAVNQNTREAWVIDANEEFSIFEVDWLSVLPDIGTIPASGQVVVDVTCYPVEVRTQTLEATLKVENETPYGPLSIEVRCTENAGLIFEDGFESGNVTAWSSSFP